ncbi:class I SAM-dependent methyltransferase [candidate division WOR-3 bacterium]|nr:class I SAM-dependent methyltransferase [candidate division WOR-3 bacterium]
MKDKTNRLYSDLAWIWPLWEGVEQYRPESEDAVKLFKEFSKMDARTLLDITCGAGKNDFTLKKYFDVTGLDASEAMLENARKLNPECTYIQGDMRDFDLGKEFDAVYVNDGIAYITTGDDLEKTFACAARHLKPGGVMLTIAEKYKGNFKQNQTKIFHSTGDEPLITYIENNFDPDPADTTSETTFVYLIRERGKLRIEHDFHTFGLFTIETWREKLKKAGFEIQERDGVYEGESYRTFICVKPL